MKAVSIVEMVNLTLDLFSNFFAFAYRAKYNEWSIALLKSSKKEACPSPGTEKETPWIAVPTRDGGDKSVKNQNLHS